MEQKIEERNCAHCAEKFTPVRIGCFFPVISSVCDECSNYYYFKRQSKFQFADLVNVKTRYRPKVNRIYNDHPKNKNDEEEVEEIPEI